MKKNSNESYNAITDSIEVAHEANCWALIDYLNGEKPLTSKVVEAIINVPNLRVDKNPNLLEAPYYFTNFFDKAYHHIPFNNFEILKKTLTALHKGDNTLSYIISDKVINTLYFLSLQDDWYSLLPSIANKLVITEKDEDTKKKTKLLSYQFKNELYNDVLISTKPWILKNIYLRGRQKKVYNTLGV